MDMDFIQLFFLLNWMIFILIGMLAIVFMVFRYRHFINGRAVAMQTLAFMVLNSIFVILFAIGMSVKLVYLVYLAGALIIVTGISTIAGYWVGKKMEEERESATERASPEKQDAGCSSERKGDK
jgi:hypothetical protein